MSKFNHSDRDDFSRRPRKEKKQRGGAKNYTHSYSNEYEEKSEHRRKQNVREKDE